MHIDAYSISSVQLANFAGSLSPFLISSRPPPIVRPAAGWCYRRRAPCSFSPGELGRGSWPFDETSRLTSLMKNLTLFCALQYFSYK